MTRAEQLKKEMMLEAPFTKTELIDSICHNIKCYGKASFYCHNHVSETRIKDGLPAILPCHENTAVEYARSEGFHCSVDYNCHGARKLVFTI